MALPTQGLQRVSKAMSQNHFTISFPLKLPAGAKAVAEELLPLMPDFPAHRGHHRHHSLLALRGSEREDAIRRVNPRGQPVSGQGMSGGSNNTHRLIRRGMPYGPNYDPKQPYDGIERGLLGYFINSSIENQYEFVMQNWVNDSQFAGSVRLNPEAKDPIVGTQDPSKSIFEIPQPNGAPPIRITGFSSFITTKASAYCFLPSIKALKFISSLSGGH